ncbi:MAG: hypothetical protein ACFFAO_20895 [Candidatus Hermodarchaeota archaeon]
MAAPKSTSKTTMESCEKCGSMMYPRLLAVKNSKAFIKILQCKVCRHWVKIK